MHKKLSISLALGTIMLTGFSPLAVNPVHAKTLHGYCSRKAREYARVRSKGDLGDIIGGSIRGRIIGGILGGKKGAKRGAKRGAFLGAIGQGANARRKRERLFDLKYDECIRRYEFDPRFES